MRGNRSPSHTERGPARQGGWLRLVYLSRAIEFRPTMVYNRAITPTGVLSLPYKEAPLVEGLWLL